MQKLLSIILTINCFCQLIASAQSPKLMKDRNATIEEARYLKSIYKTEDAIELLSGLISPGQIDEEVQYKMNLQTVTSKQEILMQQPAHILHC